MTTVSLVTGGNRGARWTTDRYGTLDVLVNNAAITYDTWQQAAGADLAVVREAASTP